MNISRVFSALAVVVACSTSANNLDPKVNFFSEGTSVGPWEFSLQFGQVQLDNKSAKTTKSSLVAKPASKDADDDALRLTWKPRGVKNEWGTPDESVMTASLMNRAWPADLSSITDNGALVLDLRVIKAPKKHVELTMECNWDWQCRSTVPLKNALKRLPRNKWVTLPIPIKCFAKDDFDFSKVTTPFMMFTDGKMTLEIADIRLVVADKELNC